LKCFNLSGNPIVPPFTHFVTDVTVASEASMHLCKQFLLKNQAADKRGYFDETKSGFERISSLIALPKAV